MSVSRLSVACCVLIFCSLSSCNSERSGLDGEKLAHTIELVKLWGYVKYNQPEATENNNWDSVFVSEFERIEANTAGPNWLREFSETLASKIKHDSGDSINMIQPCIEVSELIRSQDPVVVRSLNQIQRSTRVLNQRFVSLQYSASYLEEEYLEKQYPERPYRLLAVARFWNAINYFYLHKNLITKPLDSLLGEYLGAADTASDSISYGLVCTRMCNELNDNHCWTSSPALDSFRGSFFLPINIRQVEGKPVIAKSRSRTTDSVQTVLGLTPGLEILKFNGVDWSKYRERFVSSVTHSNPWRTELQIYALARQRRTAEPVNLVVSDGETKRTISVSPLSLSQNNDSPRFSEASIVAPSVVYIKLSESDEGKIQQTIKSNISSKAIMFDARGYRALMPTIFTPELYTGRPFVRFFNPDLSIPGCKIVDSVVNQAGIDVYKGKVIVLIDEVTQSNAEYIAMALRAHGNSILVGTRTSGADGNVKSIALPGGVRCRFTGLGVLWPDGRPTQGVGLIPDVEVKRTIKGTREGRDEILDAALKIAQESN